MTDDRFLCGDARRIDQNIDGTELTHHGGMKRVDRVIAADIEIVGKAANLLARGSRASYSSDFRSGRVVKAAPDNSPPSSREPIAHIGPGARQCEGNRVAHAGCAAGHPGGPAFEKASVIVRYLVCARGFPRRTSETPASLGRNRSPGGVTRTNFSSAT